MIELKQGDRRRIYRFAWWPQRVCGEFTWLRRYVQAQVYDDIYGWQSAGRTPAVARLIAANEAYALLWNTLPWVVLFVTFTLWLVK